MVFGAAAAGRFRNVLQTTTLLMAMGLLLGVIGWLLGGPVMVVWSVGLGLFGLAIAARNPGWLVLRLYRAEPIRRHEATDLYALVDEIAARAEVSPVPKLYYGPTRLVQAFSVGHHRAPVVLLTDGLLRRLSLREIAAILGHEISHIAHRDLRVMMLADSMTRLTRTLSMVGLILIVFNLPALATAAAHVPWTLILLLVLAPSISTLMQLALSRTREFDADLDGARLTGDPDALISALRHVDKYQIDFWEQMLLPGRRVPHPSLLRTHPGTEERVARLRTIPPSTPLQALRGGAFDLPQPWRDVHHGPPRWRLSGLWH
jgi:heat shock protein HtpX